MASELEIAVAVTVIPLAGVLFYHMWREYQAMKIYGEFARAEADLQWQLRK